MPSEAPDKLKPMQVVEAVDAWLSENKRARRADAFAVLAERTGRTPSSVAQSYYAAKRRARGVDSSDRPRRRSAPKAARLSAKPSTAIRSLTEYIEALENEVRELREFRAEVQAMLREG